MTFCGQCGTEIAEKDDMDALDKLHSDGLDSTHPFFQA